MLKRRDIGIQTISVIRIETFRIVRITGKMHEKIKEGKNRNKHGSLALIHLSDCSERDVLSVIGQSLPFFLKNEPAIESE